MSIHPSSEKTADRAQKLKVLRGVGDEEHRRMPAAPSHVVARRGACSRRRGRSSVRPARSGPPPPPSPRASASRLRMPPLSFSARSSGSAASPSASRCLTASSLENADEAQVLQRAQMLDQPVLLKDRRPFSSPPRRRPARRPAFPAPGGSSKAWSCRSRISRSGAVNFPLGSARLTPRSTRFSP